MAMRSASSPRRIYVRKGTPIVCYGGVYFGPPANKESKVDPDKEVRIEVLEKSGGKARIRITQGGKMVKNKETGTYTVKDAAVSENWSEKKLVFEKRAATEAAE